MCNIQSMWKDFEDMKRSGEFYVTDEHDKDGDFVLRTTANLQHKKTGKYFRYKSQRNIGSGDSNTYHYFDDYRFNNFNEFVKFLDCWLAQK